MALIWNARIDTTPFLAAYDALLRRWSPDYAGVNHRNVDATALAGFFTPGSMLPRKFPSEQRFDFDGLRGRLMSSSYAPIADHPNHAPMLADLRAAFDRHQEGGQICFAYETEVYLGRLPD